MGKFKRFLQKGKKKIATLMTVAALSVGTCMTAFAADGTTDTTTQISNALKTGMNQMVVDFVSYVTVILPIALTAFGVVFAVKKGKQIFKTMSDG